MRSNALIRAGLDLDDENSRTFDDFEPAPYPKDDQHAPDVYARYSFGLWDEQTPLLEGLHTTWMQNILFFAGQQWIEYDPLTGVFRMPKHVKWKQKPVANVLVPYFKHFMAKATKERPATHAVPASLDPEDIYSAKLGDDVARAKWIELMMDRKIRRTVAWLIATGNVWLLPFWNPHKGRILPRTVPVEAMKVDETGRPFLRFDDLDMPTGELETEIMECPCDEEGNPYLDEFGNYDLEREPDYYQEGDFDVRVLSPFRVRAALDCEDYDESPFFLVAEPVMLRDLYDRWPDAPPGIVGDDVTELEQFDNLVNSLPGLGSGDTFLAGQALRSEEAGVQKAFVLHYYERPSVAHPGGRYWAGTKSGALLTTPGPLPDAVWPPLIHLKEIEVPGRMHGDATATAAVGLQREYNESNGFIKEHHNMMLRGKWLVPIGANIRRGQITTQPGEVIQHTPGLVPKQAEIRPLPDAVYAERDRILKDFQHVTGFFKASMGEAPSGVTSGIAFMTLQEADDTDMGPFLAELENGVARLTWAEMQIIQKNYDEERLIRVTGENHSYRVRSFKGSDLAGILDVEPQHGSSFPWNRVAKQNMMIELAQKVPMAFTDPETGVFDVDRFRRALPVGGLGAVYDTEDEAIAQALREEEMIEAWEPVPTMLPDGSVVPPMPPPVQHMPWHNAIAHLRQHTRTLNSAAFEQWPPERQALLIAHWQETQAAIQAAMMRQAMQQAQAQQIANPEPPGGGEKKPPPKGGA